jgi:hypothetical protein
VSAAIDTKITIDRSIIALPLASRSAAFSLSEQLRQPCNVHGDPSRLVLRQDLRLERFDLAVARVDVGERVSA